MQLYSSYWVSLPTTVRAKMREYFGISRSTGTAVDGGRVVCDGSNEQDLSVVSVEKMQILLGSTETSFETLIEQTIKYFTDELEREQNERNEKDEDERVSIQKVEAEVLADAVEKLVETVTKRRGGRPKGSKNK